MAGGLKDFLRFVQMMGLNLTNLMGCLMCFVVMGSGEYFELCYWRGL